MSRTETYYEGHFVIQPAISAPLAAALSTDHWTIEPNGLYAPEGIRDYEEAERELATIVNKLRALGHTITGDMDWSWDGEGYCFGQFVMIDNTLHHRRGELILGAPEPAE